MEAEQEQVSEVDTVLEISRTDKPEHAIDLSKVDDYYLTDEEGTKYRFGDLYKEFKTVFIFIRVSEHAETCAVVLICLQGLYMTTDTKWVTLILKNG